MWTLSFGFNRFKAQTNCNYSIYSPQKCNLITNISFQNKLSSHRQLRSVYLNNNSIERIQNLDSFCRLTHLYLQRNCISKIEGLSQLTSLRRLYLGFNRISRLENIYGLDSLHELHLEQQEFSGDFSFEEKSLDSLSVSSTSMKQNDEWRHSFQQKCLKVLNISGLKLRTFECVKSLENLEHLIADGNEFQRSEDIADYITTLQLHQLDVNDCPAQKIDAHFSRKIIVVSSSLGKYKFT